MTSILIVEDQLLQAKDLARALNKLGYDVAGTPTTAQGAFRAVEEHEPDLILMDISLDGPLDGIEAADRIRARLDVPVIYLSAFSAQDLTERAKKTEPYGYISKPVGMEELKSTIEIALYKHKIDRKLRESEARRAKAEELAGLHSWSWNLKTNRLTWSAESYRAFGLSPEDTAPTLDTFLNAVHAEDRHVLNNALHDALDGKRPYEIEFRIVRPDGDQRVLYSRGEIERDSEGVPVRMVGMALDVTDRKRAEDECRHSEERFRLAMEAAEEGLWDWNIKTGEVYYSPGWSRILGYSSSEIDTGYDFWESRIHPDDRAETLEMLQSHLAGTVPQFRSEHRLMTKGGQFIWVLGKGRVTDRELNGAPKRMVGTLLNIVDRKATEQARRESEERYRLLAENTLDVIWQMNVELDFTYVNPAIYGMTGYKPDEWIGTNLRDHCDEENFRRMMLAVSSEIVKGPESSGVMFEAVMFTRNKQPIDVEIRGKVLWSRAGKPVALQGTTRDITRRKNAERRVQAGEERYRRIVETANEGIWSMDAEFRITYANRRMAAMLSYHPNEMLGKLVDSFMFPEDLEDHAEHMERRRRGISEVYERRLIKKNRDVLWMLISSSPLFDKDGEFDGSFAMFTDITERKRVEQELEAKRRLLEEAESIAGVGAWEWDIAADRFHLSDGWLRIHGSDNPRPSLQELITIAHPADRTAIAEAFEDALGSGKAYDIVHRIIRPVDGKERIVRAHAYVQRDRAGAPIRMYGASWDITERRKAEEELKESERRLSTLIGNLPGMAYRCVNCPNWTMEYISAGCYKITGYRREELEHDATIPFGRLIVPEDRDKVWNRVQEALVAGRSFAVEYRIRTKDGKERRLWEKGSAVVSTDTNEIRLEGFIADVTERKSLEAQLAQAQKMEAIGTLAGGVAHDFNNILQVVLGYAELLDKDEKLHPDLREDLGKIVDSANAGAELVGRLLTFSKKTEVRFRTLDLNRSVERLAEMLGRLLPKTISIKLSLEAPVPAIEADPTQIEQILINLAVNAGDAMPDGGTIVIGTQSTYLDEKYAKSQADVEPGLYVLLTFEDTGGGIAEDVIPHIFEPFYTTKGLGEGTGLGLAVVYGIVEGHGGFITCSSEVSRGTVFKIYFPVAKGQEVPDEQIEQPPVRAGTETILVVDDEKPIRGLGSRILSQAGYTVIEASNGIEALNVYRERGDEISLVILDWIMPEMGGEVCLKELLILNPELKVLVSSGFAMNAELKRKLQSQVKAFVDKPFKIHEMLETVGNVLEDE